MVSEYSSAFARAEKQSSRGGPGIASLISSDDSERAGRAEILPDETARIGVAIGRVSGVAARDRREGVVAVRQTVVGADSRARALAARAVETATRNGWTFTPSAEQAHRRGSRVRGVAVAPTRYARGDEACEVLEPEKVKKEEANPRRKNATKKKKKCQSKSIKKRSVLKCFTNP